MRKKIENYWHELNRNSKDTDEEWIIIAILHSYLNFVDGKIDLAIANLTYALELLKNVAEAKEKE